ncbi:Crp/Fnr family transcriptional regulator [Qipengyuania atrilutea]|uniref:Crp/Fnr family transcriptional regulator n=1 Tax=Qipengyuania atrilutea TaxID=2744473 RepID=A0A850GZ81_9SPHN|nr:Crp/Fnr family transcriptional regulator [Actirhodobacter atriluteus]NVD43510.1 Crp/Fnr family transcriptional regulator [Actirhodobacter atriluteus]
MNTISDVFSFNLARCGFLTTEDRISLDEAANKNVSNVRARSDLMCEGDRAQTVKVVLDGWVAAYKQLSDGHRQILALLLPGDMCAANAFVVERMDYSLGTLTPVRYAEIRREDFEELFENNSRILRAFWWKEMVTASIQREWTANVGQRLATARIAHLFCETHARLDCRNLARGNAIDFPLTQSDIGEATGLTAVHVNRCMQSLRAEKLVELRNRELILPNPERLRKIAMFDPAYLHA